jgi:hypothetical protein
MQPCLTSGGVFAPIVDLHRELHRVVLGTSQSDARDRVVNAIWSKVEPVFQVHFQHHPGLTERVYSALAAEVDASLSQAREQISDFRADFDAAVRSYEGVFGEMAQLGLSAESNGWSATGREQLAELTDARRLFEAVTAHPIGARNGFVWFELGWIFEAAGEAQSKVAECFYHAQRLLRGVDTNVLHSARLLMTIFEGAGALDTTVQTSLAGLPGGKAILIHDGRYPEYLGQLTRNPQVFEALMVIVAQPNSPVASAMATAVQQAVQQGLQQRSEWSARLSALITICETATKNLELQVPAEIIDDANRLQLLADRFAPGQDASELDAVTSAAMDFLTGHLAATDKELSRLGRLVAGATKERDYWLNSVKSIETEAKEGGFELHAYSITNPFKRKLKERQEQTRLLYDQCKVNLEKQEAVVVSQQLRTAKESQRHSERKVQLQELISLLEAPRLGIAAAE